MTRYSNGMWADNAQSILISFDLQFGFLAFYPKKNESWISRIVLDSAIQDDCKYSRYMHVFLSYQIAWCRKCRGLRTRGSRVPLQSWSEREINWIIKMSFRKLISQSTENRLRKLPIAGLVAEPLMQSGTFSAVVEAFILRHTNRRRKLCFYNWLTFFSLRTVGRSTNIRYCMDSVKSINAK